MAICSLGAVVDVLVARDLYNVTGMWLLVGPLELRLVRYSIMR
jgi:hypothetical protein